METFHFAQTHCIWTIQTDSEDIGRVEGTLHHYWAFRNTKLLSRYSTFEEAKDAIIEAYKKDVVG